MSSDERADEAKRRIEQRLRERREDLERRLPGISDFARQCREVFGPVTVREKLEPGVSVFPLLTHDLREHYAWKRTKRKSSSR